MRQRRRQAGGLIAVGILVAAGLAVLSGATGAPVATPAISPSASPGSTGAGGTAGAAGSVSPAAGSSGGGAAGAPGPTASQVTGNVAEGMALYLQSCASCHGQQAAGTASGPSLSTAGTALVDFVLRTGRMPLSAPNEPSRRKPPAFDDAQIRSLVAYLATLTTGPAIPDVNVSGANLSLGRDLFIQNCASCHGAGGAGGAVGGGFVAPPLDQADPKTVGEAALSGPGPMPQFSFTPDQLDAIAAYVQYLKAPASPGGLAVAEVGPVAEGFLAGTIGVVTLIVVARWIARGREEDEATASDGEQDGAAGGGTAPGERA